MPELVGVGRDQRRVDRSPNNRYLQYRATLTTTDDERTPDLRSVTVSATPMETEPPVTTMVVPANNASIRGNAVLVAGACRTTSG